jgi:hypothetical protein
VARGFITRDLVTFHKVKQKMNSSLVELIIKRAKSLLKSAENTETPKIDIGNKFSQKQDTSATKVSTWTL